MLSPDYRVSYISSIGQHVSVNRLTIIRSIRAKVCHMQQSISERNGISIGFYIIRVPSFEFRNTLLHVAHFSSCGPDDGQKVDRNMLSY